MGDMMEAADLADVSNAVEATESVADAVETADSVADAVDAAAMEAMPAAMSSAVSAAMAAAVTSAACDRDAWRESSRNDCGRDGNSNDRFLQHGSVPP
jgi:hypothetical protein